MSGASTLIRTLLIYSICLPLAIILGYMLATPLDYRTFEVVGFVLLFLTIPLFLRFHHVWLIAAWNMNALLFFLPGRPYLWLPLAWISFFIAFLQFILNPSLKFISVPSIAKPLIVFALIALATATLTGGIGIASLGSEVQGGRRYVMLISAIVGYFALTSTRIPPRRAVLYVALFFLGSLTQAIGELASLVSPAFYFIF